MSSNKQNLPANVLQSLTESSTPLRIKGLETKLVQFPSESNYQTAIISARITTDDGQTIDKLGFANKNEPGDSTTETLRRAEWDAQRSSAETVALLQPFAPRQQDSTPPWNDRGAAIDVQPSPPPSPKRQNGGGNKPASDKQKAFARRVCAERGIDAESFARQKFGKGIDDLRGSEIDILIREVKGPSY